MPKTDRDWAQLDAFVAEYAERLQTEKARPRGESQYLSFLQLLSDQVEEFYTDEVKGRDEATRRLFALRSKILTLREKVGLPDEATPLLPVERPYVREKQTAKKPQPPKNDDASSPSTDTKEKKPPRIRWIADPAPPDSTYPVTFDDLRAILAELPSEHAATVHEVRLSNQKRTGADGDWLDGEIRLHCLCEIQERDASGTPTLLRRLMGRQESGNDVSRFGGAFEWEGNRLYAVWPIEAYRTFVLRRVFIHEVAHGVAELPGYADRVRRAGSIERFCEQYAENFYRPAGKSVRLNF